MSEQSDEAGQVHVRFEFAPSGNPIPSGNSSGEPYGYTGKWYMGYTELLHLRAQWYAVETGKFLSVDPAEGKPLYISTGGDIL